MMENSRKQTILNYCAAALAGAAVALLVVTLLMVCSGKRMPGRKVNAEYGEWRKLNLILQSVSDNYVDSIDYKAITDASVEAALSKLDPHSIYMPPAQLEESETELAGNFDGIGIQFNVPNDTAVVIEVIPGGPSQKIGILAGDRIIKVDDEVIAGVKFPQDSMVRRMKGPAGTKVLITVKRDSDVIPFEITRGKIPFHCVDASFMLDDTTGYVRLSKFSRTTVEEFTAASLKLLASGMKKLVFDLRENSGGYFDQALTLSNIFLEKDSRIVYTKGMRRKREEFKADGSGFLKEMPLVVLIDENSASSSEIFAGAIQDNDRGVIIGRRSFGKGLVQEPLFFTDGSGVRLTVARFHTPSGRCIQKPYDDDYRYDIFHRYESGELTDADSIKVNKDEEYHTLNGRTVYGGGGIVPDIFVPMDTSRATGFYVECVRKATSMRFASQYFDSHKEELSAIEDFQALQTYLDNAGLESAFLAYASSKDGIRPSGAGEWNETRQYLMPQVRALVGRYSKLGDNAFYHMYVGIDNTIQEAMKPMNYDLKPSVSDNVEKELNLPESNNQDKNE